MGMGGTAQYKAFTLFKAQLIHLGIRQSCTNNIRCKTAYSIT